MKTQEREQQVRQQREIWPHLQTKEVGGEWNGFGATLMRFCLWPVTLYYGLKEAMEPG